MFKICSLEKRQMTTFALLKVLIWFIYPSKQTQHTHSKQTQHTHSTQTHYDAGGTHTLSHAHTQSHMIDIWTHTLCTHSRTHPPLYLSF